MPIFLAALGLLAGVAIWMVRARNAAHAARELVDVANDVRLAARRFGFSRRANIHPSDSIEDPHVAIGAIGVAFLELDALPAHEQQIALGRGLQRELRVSLGDAEELMVLGRWLMTECNGPSQTITRVGKRLFKLDNGHSFSQLMGVIKDVAAAGNGLSDQQSRALEDLKRAFRMN